MSILMNNQIQNLYLIVLFSINKLKNNINFLCLAILNLLLSTSAKLQNFFTAKHEIF